MSTTYETLDNALEILDKDLSKIKKLAEDEKTLDRNEATKLTDYIKTLISVHKDEREQAKSTNLLAKSDDELEELAKQALEFLKPPKVVKKKKKAKKKPSKEKEDEPTDSIPSKK